jgi:phage terminase large subunit
MRSRGWGKAWLILPHDGAAGDKVLATSYKSAIREGHFDVLVGPNQAPVRPRPALKTLGVTSNGFFFMRTLLGRQDALGWYHERKSNDDRNIGSDRTTIEVRTPLTVSA